MQGTYALRPDVVATVMEDGAVLLDLRTRYFYSANAPAWFILQVLEAGASAQEVLRHCAAVAGDQLDGPALDSFLGQLVAEDLVQPVPAAGALTAPPALGGAWTAPTLLKHSEPLQRIMVSAFDPSIPLAE